MSIIQHFDLPFWYKHMRFEKMAHCLGPLMLLFCFESASGPEKCAPESKLSHQNRSTSGTIEAHHASSWIGYSSSPILFSHYLRSHPTQPDERQRQRERSMRDHRPGGEINHSKMNNFDFTKWIDSLSPHCTEQGGRSLWTWKLTWKKKPPLADLFLRSSTIQFQILVERGENLSFDWPWLQADMN